MPPDPLSRGDLARVIGLIVVLWAVLFAPQLFACRVYVLGDAASFRPFAEFSRERWLASHERTFWNPYVFTGLPATSSLADARPQYLPGPVLDWVERLYQMPGWPPLAVPLIVHLVGMLSAAWLARALWQAGPAGMTWAGLAWGWMPNLLVPLGFGHDSQFVSASLIPAVLLATHHLFSSRSGLAVAWSMLALASALGLQSLAAHPQIVVYSALLAVSFAVERAWRLGRPRRLALAAGAAAWGAATSAAIWWPASLYSAHSIRGGSAGEVFGEAAQFSHAFRDLGSLVWPWAVGFGDATYWGGLRATDYPQYLGITVVVLALWGWPRRDERSGGTTLFFFAVATIAVLMSLGTHLPWLFAFVHDSLPLFSRFRVPVAILILAQLSLALLSARGLETVLRRSRAEPKRHRPWFAWTALAVLVVGVAAALAWSPVQDLYVTLARGARPGMSMEQASTVASRGATDLMLRGFLVAGLGAIVFRLGRSRLRAVAPFALASLLIVDLGSVSMPILRRATGPLERLEPPPPPPLARVVAADPLSRALSLESRTFLSNQWVSWRARALAGEHAAVTRRWNDLMRRGLVGRHRALCALAVRYVAGDGTVRVDTSLCDPVPGGDPARPVLRLRGSLPRAYGVPRVIAPGSEEAVLAGLLADGFDPTRTAFASTPEAAGDYPGSPGCRVRWTEDSPDRLAWETEAEAPAFLVVADAHFPGWRAWIDDRPVPLHRVNYLVRGVAIPTGRHRLTMRYEPEGWSAGMTSTRISLGLILLLSVSLAGITIATRRSSLESKAKLT